MQKVKKTVNYSFMKKILLSLTVAAFAFAVQAGDAKKEKDSKDAPSCCAAKTGAQTKATCTDKSKTACSGGACKDAPSKRVLLSPKAAAEVGR